jgi:hypothetical protein
MDNKVVYSVALFARSQYSCFEPYYTISWILYGSSIASLYLNV